MGLAHERGVRTAKEPNLEQYGSSILVVLLLLGSVAMAAFIAWQEFRDLYVDRQTLSSIYGHARLILVISIESLLLVAIVTAADRATGFLNRTVNWLSRNNVVAIGILAAGCIMFLVLCVVALRAFPNSGD